MTDNRRTNAIAYRADIDGLRAVAIVPVVLYHAEIAPFGGGYVGVDIFFVISGYLITSFILGQIQRGEFTLLNFYLRRIRRIFPALFLMMAFCAAIGWLLLTPDDYRRLGESIFATVFFCSNILFWLQSGYFATQPEARPLLHTWSLGVEEQFYVVFPVLLVLLSRYFPRRLIAITLALSVLSFGFNVLSVSAHPSLAFFLAPPRIWELFIGALLAMGALAAPSGVIWSEAASLLGVALIGYAIFGFSRDTMFPGFAALLPTIGAAAIIWAGTGHAGRATRLLSHPAPVLIGKISYSLYLWHFPLLAFGAYVLIGGLSLIQRLSLIALSMVLAFGSWIFVEQPVRRGRSLFGRARIVFVTAAAALAVFGGFGLAAHLSGGFPSRIGEPGLRILASADDVDLGSRSMFEIGGLHGHLSATFVQIWYSGRCPSVCPVGGFHTLRVCGQRSISQQRKLKAAGYSSVLPGVFRNSASTDKKPDAPGLTTLSSDTWIQSRRSVPSSLRGDGVCGPRARRTSTKGDRVHP